MTAAIVHDERGGRSIKLYQPFTFQGARIEAVNIGPIKWGHTLRWQEGRYRQPVDLLVELTGMQEVVLREIAYPDISRVLANFVEMLPEEVRADIIAGRAPERADEGEGEAEAERAPPPPPMPMMRPRGDARAPRTIPPQPPPPAPSPDELDDGGFDLGENAA